MITDISTPVFKYNIKVRLISKAIEVNDLFLALVEKGFDINISTLSRYINLKFDGDQSIPSDILKEIASFLNTTMENLYNE